MAIFVQTAVFGEQFSAQVVQKIIAAGTGLGVKKVAKTE